MTKIRVYFGHKLTKADQEFLDLMESFKKFLETELTECIFLKFLGLTNGTRADVYEQDILKNVASCDLFVCYVNAESTGLGIEIAAALWKCGKPILVLATQGAHVSRLVGGTVDHNPGQMIERSILKREEAAVAIRDAIQHFKLDTLHPVQFPSFDSMLPKPPFMEEAPVYAVTRQTATSSMGTDSPGFLRGSGLAG